MKSFDIFIHSTISGGGLSNSLLEAMSTDNAIIATKAEGAAEVLDKNSSITINKSDFKLFKKSFEILIKNKKLQKKLASNAKSYVKDSFSWNKKVEQYIKVLK